jgi:hypothetical protein
VRDRVAFQDDEGSDSCAAPVGGVEAARSPRLRPRHLRHLPELFLIDLAGHRGIRPRIQAQDVSLGHRPGGQVGEHAVHKRLRREARLAVAVRGGVLRELPDLSA